MYSAYIVKRTQIYLEESQDQRLSSRARQEGVTKSSLIREAIDAYLEGPGEEARRLARFRVALEEAAGAAARLPEGRAYVARIRRGDVRRLEALERRRR